MRYDYPMMMAGSTTIAAPRMDRPSGVPAASASSAFHPLASSSSCYYSTPLSPLSPLSPSSSRPQPHRRSSNASASTAGGRRHRSTSQQAYQRQQQQQFQQPQQPQLLFYPPIVPYQQMPYHSQLPYQHQRTHSLLHGNHYTALPYSNTVNTVNTAGPSHGYRRHYLLPHAPPTSQQHSTSSSFSSSQQLSVLQKQQLQAQAQAHTEAQTQTQTQTLPLSASKIHMALVSAVSLRGSNHNKLTAAACSSSQKLQPGSMGTKPPVRDPKAKVKADRSRGPVDAKDLSQRLHNVLAQRELQRATRANGSAHSLLSGTTINPVLSRSQEGQQHQQQLGDRSGQRIRSRGSGNLRALYASNGTMPPPAMTTSGTTGSIRRQPFSAPHLGALAPPPSLPELQRRRSRTRSLSPQQVSMRRGGGAISSANAHHGMAHVPSQAAQQFARTTVAIGGTRKSTLLQKPRQAPYNHNQFEARSSPPPPPPPQQQQQKQKSSKSPSPAEPGTNATSSIKSPVLPSMATAATVTPAVQHARKDSLLPPGSKRQSLKDGADEAAERGTEDAVAAEAPEAEADVDADVEEARAKVSGAKKIVSAADLRRMMQEHSVDRTQSDETSAQRKKEKKEKKEHEKEKKARQQQKQQKLQSAGSDADAAKQGRPLWRLKARLSSFSKDNKDNKDKVASSTQAVSVLAVAEESETRKAEDKACAGSVTNADDVLPKVQEVEALSTAGEAKVAAAVPETAAEVPVAADLTSTSSSVLSLTGLAKSASFLSRFKH